MVNLFRTVFGIGIILILIAFISIIIGWYGFASVVGIIGSILAIIGFAPVLVLMVVSHLYQKDVNNST